MLGDIWGWLREIGAEYVDELRPELARIRAESAALARALELRGEARAKGDMNPTLDGDVQVCESLLKEALASLEKRAAELGIDVARGHLIALGGLVRTLLERHL
jgi:hypothetical protein